MRPIDYQKAISGAIDRLKGEQQTKWPSYQSLVLKNFISAHGIIDPTPKERNRMRNIMTRLRISLNTAAGTDRDFVVHINRAELLSSEIILAYHAPQASDAKYKMRLQREWFNNLITA